MSINGTMTDGAVEASLVKGALYVVATPIGNLGDISPRAIDVLSTVDLIAAEDTRHSKKLFRHFNINTRCLALHEHNERKLCADFVEHMTSGRTIALISDAGTPLISDPGYHIINAAYQASCQVIPIPGPSALISALSVSGLATHRFTFEGFLPVKSSARRHQLESLRDKAQTLVFFESPHRIVDTLQDMVGIFGAERFAVIARELTKIHETIHRDSLAGLLGWIQRDTQQQRGEFVVMVQGRLRSEIEQDISEYQRVIGLLLAELPLKKAVSVAAQLTGARKNLLYDLAVQLSEQVTDV